MTSDKPGILAAAIAVCLALVVSTTSAWVDVKVEYDKAFNFKAVKTWAWNPEGAGKVMMAQTPDDDPEAMRKLAEPVIFEAVETEMPRRGMAAATTAPDVVVNYYLLLTTTVSAQTMGQFLPATTAWGLPPFPPATQSMKMMNRGSLVLDMSAKGTVVWRGVAQAQIKPYSEIKKREALLREAVRDLLKRFPPKA